MVSCTLHSKRLSSRPLPQAGSLEHTGDTEKQLLETKDAKLRYIRTQRIGLSPAYELSAVTHELFKVFSLCSLWALCEAWFFLHARLSRRRGFA
jgi:hypothetical protein